VDLKHILEQIETQLIHRALYSNKGNVSAAAQMLRLFTTFRAMADIFHQVMIKADKQVIYHAITTQGGLSGWWSVKTIARAEKGFVNVFRFGNTITNRMEVTRLKQNRCVEWICIDSVPEWIGTRIIFEIREKDGVCFLNFHQNGYREANDFYANCNYNWGRYMGSLKSLCETGKGAPFNDEEDMIEVEIVQK